MGSMRQVVVEISKSHQFDVHGRVGKNTLQKGVHCKSGCGWLAPFGSLHSSTQVLAYMIPENDVSNASISNGMK